MTIPLFVSIGSERVHGMEVFFVLIKLLFVFDFTVACRSAKQNLLSFLFEMNPLDGACDQRIAVDSQPLQIVYDAVSFLRNFNIARAHLVCD